MYLDPPYFADRTNGYKEDANEESFHFELLELANKAKCMIFISGYENELYSRMLTDKKGWLRKTIETTTRDSTGNIHARTEVVWTNKYFQTALKENKIQVKLSTAEKKSNKVNPERKS